MTDDEVNRIARNLHDGIIHLEDADELVMEIRALKANRAACLLVVTEVGPREQPTRAQWVRLAALVLGRALDGNKHAPLCPANHYHAQRIPSGRCTCGSEAYEAARKAAGATK